MDIVNHKKLYHLHWKWYSDVLITIYIDIQGNESDTISESRISNKENLTQSSPSQKSSISDIFNFESK